jgi:hypothetical protein
MGWWLGEVHCGGPFDFAVTGVLPGISSLLPFCSAFDFQLHLRPGIYPKEDNR